jgi:hypothetical protein
MTLLRHILLTPRAGIITLEQARPMDEAGVFDRSSAFSRCDRRTPTDSRCRAALPIRRLSFPAERQVL